MKIALPQVLLSTVFTAAALLVAQPAHGITITVSFQAGTLEDENGGALAAGSLLQLINLGANGVFDPIKEGSWVGGDDQVITIPLGLGAGSSESDTSLGFFDLTEGADTAGILDRVFTLELGTGVNTGDRVGIRWFSSILASNASYSAPPAAGTAYGQFTRLSDPLHGGSDWILPTAGSFVMFDPLITAGLGGLDLESAATANLRVLSQSTNPPQGVPDSGSTIPLLLATLSGLFWFKQHSNTTHPTRSIPQG